MKPNTLSMKLRAASLLALCLFVTAADGCASPIVGEECRDDLSLCGNECVDTDVDFRNCGACGHDCGEFICDKGMCTKDVRPDAGPGFDGGPRDASVDAGDAGDAGTDSGPLPPIDGGFNPDAGLGGCSLGEQACNSACVDTTSDPKNCGDCDQACKSSEVCSAGNCSAVCDAPLSACGSSCFDLSNDPDHCGTCTNDCASGICEDGKCADAVAGHSVVIGHDLVASNKTMQRIAGNAVFLGRGAPVRVLSYEGSADPTSVAGVRAAINVVKAEIGRNWKETKAIEGIVPLQLKTADVFLIHAQTNARKSTITKLGTQWGTALAQFVVSGGVIVLFEAPSTLNDGTFRILEPAQIFSATKRDAIANQQLKVVAPGIALSARVSDRYMSAKDTVVFSGLKTAGTVMVVDKNMAPVVVDRVIVP